MKFLYILQGEHSWREISFVWSAEAATTENSVSIEIQYTDENLNVFTRLETIKNIKRWAIELLTEE